VGKDERWSLSFLDNGRHSKGFACTRGPEQSLKTVTTVQPIDQSCNGRTLVPFRLKVVTEHEGIIEFYDGHSVNIRLEDC
jgi:hypothetical protein